MTPRVTLWRGGEPCQVPGGREPRPRTCQAQCRRAVHISDLEPVAVTRPPGGARGPASASDPACGLCVLGSGNQGGCPSPVTLPPGGHHALARAHEDQPVWEARPTGRAVWN